VRLIGFTRGTGSPRTVSIVLLLFCTVRDCRPCSTNRQPRENLHHNLPCCSFAHPVNVLLAFNKHCLRGWTKSPRRGPKIFGCFLLKLFYIPHLSFRHQAETHNRSSASTPPHCAIPGALLLPTPTLPLHAASHLHAT